MEHDQSSYFCRGPDDFCWGPAPVGPAPVGPGDGAAVVIHYRYTCNTT